MKLSDLCILLLATLCASASAQPSNSFSFETVRQRAAELAKKDYIAPDPAKLPSELESLDYNQYQQLQFRPEASPWYGHSLRFDLRLISRGFIFHDAVKLHIVDASGLQDIRFNSAMFKLGDAKLTNSLPPDLDFAGFKIVYRTDDRQPWEEMGSFLGASYFRIVGKGLRYGASARALALDTGETAGEEFPRFTEFWLKTPEPLADQLQLFALLDSPSTAGACRFVFEVGARTCTEAEVCLFPRGGNKKYGLVALTSMFLMGENRTRYIPDFRPEVHDSDGLLIVTESGERLWRPLENPPARHRISRFPLHNPAGFGLMQRDRLFQNYQDLEARYDLRPSFWVEPLEGWGEGRIELVEIPSPSEFNDNIVAYWVPGAKPEPGHELKLQYRLSAIGEEPPSSLLRVLATRIAPAVDKRPAKYVIDFNGATLDASNPVAAIQPHYTATGGEVKNPQATYNEVTGGWRVVFDFQPGEGEGEIRLYLEAGGKRLSETWVQRMQSEK